MAVQFIKSARRGKPVTWFVYAYKGGPRVMKHEGPRKPKLTPEVLRKVADAVEARGSVDTAKFAFVVAEWRRSPEWTNLEPGTRRVWGRHLDMIEARWGAYPLTIWNDPRMTAKVMKWRNERADTPRTADIGVTVLVQLLKWARQSGQGIIINAATDIPRLYKGADREEIIWLAEDMERFAAVATKEKRPQLYDGLRLAVLTGLRRADLVSLTFDHVGEFAVSKIALKKSGGRRRKATIPMTADLEALLAELRTRYRLEGTNTVLVNSFGRAWSGDGFGGSFNRIRDLAGIVHTDPETGKAKRKHLHDVRGTFCTMLLAECGLTDEQAASIMAWSKERVSRIRKAYVDDAAVVVAIGARIAEQARAKREAKQ